jgi:hypothetical protein
VTSLPDWLVERAALDEVPAASRDRIAKLDPSELETRVAALRAENAAELAKYPAASAVPQIEARVAAAKRRARAKTIGALGLAIATAAAVLLVVRVRQSAAPSDAPEITRVKGGARLLVFRQVGGGAERLDADAEVRAGDVLQLRYNPGERRFGVIASLDGAGVATLHFPATDTAPTDLKPTATALPEAYALDDAPSFERFFFITSDAPIDVADTLARVRALAQAGDAGDAALALPPGQQQWSLRLRKPNP